MKVKHACNILSNTVYASIQTLVEDGKMDVKALATSIYCKRFNDLFDVMNSSSSLEAVPLRKPLEDNSEGVIVLLESLNWLKELEELNLDRPRTKFLSGFRQSINVILLLRQEFSKRRLPYLSTRRLCQDTLELFFSKIRLFQTHPTPAQFLDFFNKINVCSLMTAPLRSNCEEEKVESRASETMNLLHNVSEFLIY